VYGLSKKALTAESSDLSFKAGNTIAKEKDEKVLTNEPDALPVPTDEYLVSRMPALKEEFRIPYPEAAKAGRIQGAVVMDLLIDIEGIVRDVVLVSGPGGGLNEAALDAVMKFKFTPAYREAEPVAVRIRYAYRFILEK
jgi:protein TonB